MAHLLPLSMNFTSFNLRNFKLFINMDLPLLVLSSCPPWSGSLSLFFKGFIFKLRSHSGLIPKERQGYVEEMNNCFECQRQTSQRKSLSAPASNLELIKPHYLRQVQAYTCSYPHGQGYPHVANNLHWAILFLSNLDFPNKISLCLANRITWIHQSNSSAPPLARISCSINTSVTIIKLKPAPHFYG